MLVDSPGPTRRRLSPKPSKTDLDSSNIDLVCGNAGWGFIAADLVDPHAVVADSAVKVFDKVPGDVLGGRVQLFVEGRQLVKVAVVEIGDDLVGRLLQVAEIDQQADIVQLLAAGKYLDLIIMSVQVLTLSLI